MRIFLFLLCALATMAALGILGAARSAIHEIEAFMLFLIAAVFLSGAAIIEAVNLLGKKLLAAIESIEHEVPSRPAVPPAAPPAAPTWNSAPAPPSPSPPPALPPTPSSIDELELVDDREERADELYNQAKAFANGGDGHAAMGTLRQVVRLFPQSRAADKARRMLSKNGAAS